MYNSWQAQSKTMVSIIDECGQDDKIHITFKIQVSSVRIKTSAFCM